MRVLINRLTALRQKTGVGHYIASLAFSLQQRSRPGDIVLYPGAIAKCGLAAWQTCKKCMPSRKRKATKTAETRDHLSRALAGWHFSLATRGLHCDLYHEPNSIPWPSSLPTVVTVHDLSVILHPTWHPAGRVAFYERHFEEGIRRARHVLTVSEFTRQEVLRTFNLRPEHVTRTYNGIRAGLRPMSDAEFRPVLHRLGLPQRYLLYVGTLEPRKNLSMLLRAYCRLPEPVRTRTPLVLAGRWGWNVADLHDFYEKEARHRGVIHLGYVCDEDLAPIYNGARALVFPSHYEGFGLPPVEMLACGGVVLCSTAPALVETVGASAHSVAANDEDGWYRGLFRVITDDHFCQSLRVAAIATAAPFTWERCAAETWQVYRSVLGAGQISRAA